MSKRNDTRIERHCEKCHKVFTTTKWYIEKGWAKFCSRTCKDLKNGTLEERFWKFVVKGESVNDCWEWVGSKSARRYGHLGKGQKLLKAHRYSWELHNNQQVPDGMSICHKCDNPECTNPLHLFVGTHQENMDDMMAKGRRPPITGTRQWKCRFTEEQVIDIRSMHTDGHSRKEICDKYNANSSIIGKIVNGKLWRHLLPIQDGSTEQT